MNLVPQQYTLSNGNSLYGFQSGTLDLLKLDFSFEAGFAYQPQKMCAVAANKLFTEASMHQSVQQVAEFFDYRGIAVEQNTDIFTGVLSVYTLRRYAEELFPLLAELFTEPAFPQREFEVFCDKRRQQLRSNFQRTNYVARNLFYEALYGNSHPMGAYAKPDSIDRLSLSSVKDFYRDHYRLSKAHLVLSGNYDDTLLKTYDRWFGQDRQSGVGRKSVTDYPVSPEMTAQPCKVFQPIPQAVQSTIRIGRVLPFCWNDIDYARFMVLNTILGGYFGSRLMSNIREDKGYTYGIYSQTQIFRGCIVFFIVADVGGDVSQEAVEEVYKEIERLQTEPIPTDELDVVRHYMEGDFVRSIDGIFECSERYRQMFATDVDESFTDNYFEAIRTVTPQQLMQLAQQVLRRDQLVEVVVGK